MQMATVATDTPYTPFQRELLQHIGQISTNVNTLIQVFVNLHTSLSDTSAHAANSNSNAFAIAVQTDSPTLETHRHLSPIPVSPDCAQSNHVESTLPVTTTTAADTTIDVDDDDISAKSAPNNHANNATADHPDHDEQKTEAVAHHDPDLDNLDPEADEPQIVASLDSSDSDHDHDNNGNSSTPHKASSKPPSKLHKGYTVSTLSLKHRSRHAQLRSKSISTALPSPLHTSHSMSTLLRANHLRTHKYNGVLKSSKYRHHHPHHKKNYNHNGNMSSADQKSDSIVGTASRPRFDPEHVFLSKDNRISINVGGSMFETTLNTLSSDQTSMLSAMFSGRFNIERDENGAIFIDRDPTHFRHILNFLRDGIEYLKHGGLLQQSEAIVSELLQEARYYNLRPLVDYIQLQQTRKNKKQGDELTHEKQYKLVTNIGVDEFQEVFNKYTGSAGYDFEEWLYIGPHKTSRNSVSPPSFIMLFSKKLSKAEVRLLDRLTNIDFQ